MFCNIAESPGSAKTCLGFWISKLGHDSAIPYSSLALFLVQLPVISSFPCREISLSHSSVNLAINGTSFCPDRNKKLCLLLFFLQLILRFSVHSAFHYFSSERTPKVPKYLNIFPDRMLIFFCISS